MDELGWVSVLQKPSFTLKLLTGNTYVVSCNHIHMYKVCRQAYRGNIIQGCSVVKYIDVKVYSCCENDCFKGKKIKQLNTEKKTSIGKS